MHINTYVWCVLCVCACARARVCMYVYVHTHMYTYVYSRRFSLDCNCLNTLRTKNLFH